MATEYDLLSSLVSRSEKYNQETPKRFDKQTRIRKLLSSLRTLGRTVSCDDRESHSRNTQMS